MKKMMRSIIIGGLILMSGCSAPVERPEPETVKPTIVTPEPTAAPTVSVPSEPTPTETPEPTPTETPLPTPTETPVPTPTETPLPTPTETPEPTPSPVPVVPELPFSEKIPVLSVATKDGQPILSREDYLECLVSVFNTEEYNLYENAAGIRVRGNSSAYYGKEEDLLTKEVPYRIKFEEKTNLLGLNDGAECKSWVLLRADEGLVRDEIAFRMGRVLLGENNYCSDSQLIHLYVNEEFKGVFLLCEQSQVNKHRVDVYEPKKEETRTDIGYFLEIDNYADKEEHPCFRMNYEKATVTDIEGVTNKFTYAYYSIKSDTTSKEQENFIAAYTQNMFKLVYEACVNQNFLTFDENYKLVKAEYGNAKDTIGAVMDLDSVVGSYILEEMMHDNDCGEGSFFMCIDFSEESKYPKFTFTCPWDYNWTCQGDAKGQYYAAAFNDPEFVDRYGDRSNPWFILLMGQEWFVEMVREKWTQVRESGALEACFREQKEYMEEYKSDLNRKKEIATATGYAILDWLERRASWLDEEWLLR